VLALGFVYARGDGSFEGIEIFIIMIVETFLFDEFPQALDQIQVGRVWRQEKQFDFQCKRQVHDQTTMLIAGIVHDEGHRQVWKQLSQLLKQLTDGLGIDVAIIADGDDLFGNGIQCPQNVEALPSAGRLDENAHKAPEITQKRAKDKMGGINEEKLALTCFGLFQPWL